MIFLPGCNGIGERLYNRISFKISFGNNVVNESVLIRGSDVRWRKI